MARRVPGPETHKYGVILCDMQCAVIYFEADSKNINQSEQGRFNFLKRGKTLKIYTASNVFSVEPGADCAGIMPSGRSIASLKGESISREETI